MKHKNFKCLSYVAAIYSFLFLFPSILLHRIIALPLIGVIPISILFTGAYFSSQSEGSLEN